MAASRRVVWDTDPIARGANLQEQGMSTDNIIEGFGGLKLGDGGGGC